MTPVFCCGFECGQFGNVGQHWALTGTGAISTTTVRSGARSFRINPSAAGNSYIIWTGASNAVSVARFYIRYTTLPTANALIYTYNTGGATPCVAFNISDSKIYPATLTGVDTYTFGSTGATITTGVWYRIDVNINGTSDPTTIDVSVDGTSLTQLTRSGTTSSSVNAFGQFSSTVKTYDAFFDDIIFSNTSGDYPIGAGYVNHFVPTSDGTHTSTGTLIEKGTIATPTGGGGITSATTDAFNWVNGVPLLGGATDNTRLINNSGTTTALYCEEIFGAAPGIATPSSPPRAVEVITADRQAATTVGVFSTKLNDNGTESTIINRTGAGVVTDRFVTKQYATPPTGGAWTLVSGAGNFNNIRARFGYSSDANPDQYWRGIMIEAEFEAAVVSTNLLPFCIAPQGTR